VSDWIWKERYFTWRPGEPAPSITDWLNTINVAEVCVTAFNTPGDRGGTNCLLVCARVPVIPNLPVTPMPPPTKGPTKTTFATFPIKAEVPKPVAKAKRSSKQK